MACVSSGNYLSYRSRSLSAESISASSSVAVTRNSSVVYISMRFLGSNVGSGASVTQHRPRPGCCR
jgi:hypothetical protein